MYNTLKSMIENSKIAPPVLGNNESGEVCIISEQHTEDGHSFAVTTYQDNGWVRKNIYHEDGCSEELFERAELESISFAKDAVMRSEYSEQFDKERKYRVQLSFYKYGPARKNYSTGRVDALATAERCIEAFKKDNNTEHLIDAANYLMFRYMYPMPGEYFRATESNEAVPQVGTCINKET